MAMTSLRVRRHRLPLRASVLTVGAVALPAIATSRAQGAATGCTLTYTTNEWSGGFTAQIRVTNLGAALNGWRLEWTYGGNQQVTSAWNAQVTQSGSAVTAVNVAHNAVLAAGGSVDFGLQGTWRTADPAPTAFALNGTPCGGTASPTPTATATATAPAECTGATLCSDFEDQTGTGPSGPWQTTAPDCQGTGKASVDTSVAHSSTRSLRVDGGAGYCNHVFAASTRDLSSVGPVVYVRIRVRHTTALPTNHATFLSMPDAGRLTGRQGAARRRAERRAAGEPRERRRDAAGTEPGGGHAQHAAADRPVAVPAVPDRHHRPVHAHMNPLTSSSISWVSSSSIPYGNEEIK
jgi:hypothetical protein